MSSKDMHADTSLAHRRSWDAIPWVVNGSADAALRREVEAHARACTDCRDELVRQRELQRAMAQDGPALTDADAGLQRLLRRIDQASQVAGEVPRVAARRPGGSLVHWLAAAVVVEAIGLSVMGAGMLFRGAAAPAYQTLSSPARETGAVLRIVPAPGLRMDELHSLLRGLELQVVSGPNGAGAYGLAPLSGPLSPAQLDAKVSALRAAAGMRLVEPVGAGGTGS